MKFGEMGFGELGFREMGLNHCSTNDYTITRSTWWNLFCLSSRHCL